MASAFRVVRRSVGVPDGAPCRVQHPPPPGHPQMGHRPFAGQARFRHVAHARQRLGEPGVRGGQGARRDHPDRRAPLVGTAPAAPVVVAPQHLQQGGGIVVGEPRQATRRLRPDEPLHGLAPLRALGMPLGIGIDVGWEVAVFGGVEAEPEARLGQRGGVHQPVFEASAPLLRLDALIRSPQGEPARVDPAVALPAVCLPVRDLDAARPGDDPDLELEVRAQALDAADHLRDHVQHRVVPERAFVPGHTGLRQPAAHAVRHVEGEHELHLVRDALDLALSGGLLRQGHLVCARRDHQGLHDFPPGEGGLEIDPHNLIDRVARHAYLQALQRLAPVGWRQVQQVEPGVALGLPAQHLRAHAHALRAHLPGRREPGRGRRILHPLAVRVQGDVRHRQRGGADQHGGHQDAGDSDRRAGVPPQPRQRTRPAPPACPCRGRLLLTPFPASPVFAEDKPARRGRLLRPRLPGVPVGTVCAFMGRVCIHDVVSQDGSGDGVPGVCGRPVGAAGGRVAGSLKGMALAR